MQSTVCHRQGKCAKAGASLWRKCHRRSAAVRSDLWGCHKRGMCHPRGRQVFKLRPFERRALQQAGAMRRRHSRHDTRDALAGRSGAGHIRIPFGACAGSGPLRRDSRPIRDVSTMKSLSSGTAPEQAVLARWTEAHAPAAKGWPTASSRLPLRSIAPGEIGTAPTLLSDRTSVTMRMPSPAL